MNYPGKDAGSTGDGGSIQIMGTTNRCPVIALGLSPLDAKVGETIALSASGSDDDTGSVLTYLWSAGAGAFGDKTAAQTSYTCTSGGPQIVTVAVSDGKCTVTQTAPLYCYGLPGSGGSPGSGNGGSGKLGSGGSTGAGGRSSGSGGVSGGGGAKGTGGSGSGSGGSTASDPTTDEGSACNQCTLENCIPSTDGCALDRLFTDAKQQACFALYSCIRAKECVDSSDNPEPCWCGTVAPSDCEMGKAPANGPCAQEYGVASESSDPALIFQRFVNPNYASGSADNLAICRATFCPEACKIGP